MDKEYAPFDLAAFDDAWNAKKNREERELIRLSILKGYEMACDEADFIARGGLGAPPALLRHALKRMKADG